MMLKRIVVGLCVVAGLGGAYMAHAQLSSTDSLTITINPNYPRPYQIVTVTPSSTVIDLSASTITFSVNGTVVQKGTGTESASIAMGGPGQTTTITVTAVNNGNTYTKSLSVHPADVALILEPISTNHPFYEGGALVGTEGRIRLIAVPDLRTAKGTPIPASSLVYTWKNGDQILQSDSGIGKSVLTATAPVRYRDATITVTVSSQDSSVVGQAQTIISPVDPEVRIYENDPLLGPRFDTALPKTVALNATEATYRAVAYYFTAIPSLSWEVNGTASQTGQDITVRPSGEGKGTALLGAIARTTAPRQTVNSTLSVTFGTSATNIFGF